MPSISEKLVEKFPPHRVGFTGLGILRPIGILYNKS